jgi:hypothetical protein
MKSPERRLGDFVVFLWLGYWRRLPVAVVAAADSLLALGALSIHPGEKVRR